MPAQLKVFRATLGFYEAVVAAASQAAALRAWGVRENLFQHGAAAATDDPLATEPALAQPGVVLRRAVGGTGQFAAEPDPPAAPAPKRSAKAGKSAPLPPPPKPKPDRAALDASERALADAESEHAKARKALAAERVALEAREARLEREHEVRRRELDQALKVTRRAYVRAGGED